MRVPGPRRALMLPTAFALLVLMPVSGLAAPPRHRRDVVAREHFERGKVLFAAGQYEDALREFGVSYALEATPAFLLNQGQCYRKLNLPEKAIERFRLFVKMATPRDPHLADVERLISTLQAEIETRATLPAAVVAPAPPPPEPPRSQAPVPASASTPTVIEERPAPARARAWRRDATGAALSSLGLATLSAGVVLLALPRPSAYATYDQFATASSASAASPTYDAFATASDSADLRRILGIVGIGVGSLVALGGVLRYGLVARSARARLAPR